MQKCSHWFEIWSGTKTIVSSCPSLVLCITTVPVPCSANKPLHYFRYRGEVLPNNYKVTVPTMIIWGTQDFALSTSMVAASAKWIPDLEVKYIPSAGHWVQQQEPEKVNQYMREFLGKK